MSNFNNHYAPVSERPGPAEYFKRLFKVAEFLLVLKSARDWFVSNLFKN